MNTKLIATFSVIFGCFICITLLLAQTKKTNEKVTAKPPKIEMSKVPAVVTDEFYRTYPTYGYDNWYGYPTMTDESDWYGYNPYHYNYENPDFFVVEFAKDKVATKLLVNKNGNRIATHRNFSGNLPIPVTRALASGEYKTYTILTEKEEIFKDKDSDEMKVYKIQVEKGKDKHVLFYHSDGKLLKDKTIEL